MQFYEMTVQNLTAIKVSAADMANDGLRKFELATQWAGIDDKLRPPPSFYFHDHESFHLFATVVRSQSDLFNSSTLNEFVILDSYPHVFPENPHHER